MRAVIILIGALLTQSAWAQVQRLDALSGEPITINPSVPPTGVQLFQVLFENSSMSLKGTACSTFGEKDTLTLQHQLAMILGFGLDVKQYKTNLVGQCKADRFEVSGKVIDAWSCEINATETTKKGKYIANGSIRIGLTKDTWQVVPDSLLCL
jgi:hypothetical protein